MPNLTIHLQPGTPRLGLWCDRCLTSAAFELDVYAFTGSSAWIIATVHKCDRCDYGDEE